ncbi:methyltransferase domain-containing protein [Aquibacillus koreensis]|uniref:Uncharacterized methyltransferase NC661_07575 n=1 Tax=Aquibacillus koreensis TaxID=279446 RepID=A0A9X3WN04_9BACI|nr:class I SAM-dependent methyltransferase [Aquibacillus koreensis]MCT2535773.1 methyltransferase domain-containing protein [Aquibacillus koreensis]MDC3420229.1 methyltransferase domain-containing protein [Aquibacillus koreensis]
MGREFVELFDKWASSYDDTVTGHDPQYAAVFENYDTILTEVAAQAEGNVLEFGVGTGNLSKKMLDQGHYVIGVEPSPEMRRTASMKYPELELHDGDFLNFPTPKVPVFTIVSTYAFHHLTDEEKDRAIQSFAELLPENGKVVFADTAYKDEDSKQSILQHAKENGYEDLLYDLSTEYYPMIDTLQKIFNDHGFFVTFKQMNTFAWLIVAEKE